jgi:hypothetical protein
MNPYLPDNRQDADEVEEFTSEEDDRLVLADDCGLVYIGRNSEGQLEFIGTEAQFANYELMCNNL